MLIVCSGPDTYRARHKARELMTAFRKKFDVSGYATEVLEAGSAFEEIMGRIGTVSLFTPKRFVRADGCLKKMPIAQVRSLAAKLEADKDQTILLTVEEDVPADKTLEALKTAPLVHYPFVMLRGVAFQKWVKDEGATRGVIATDAARIAEYTEGDSWFAIHELEKCAANPASIGQTMSINEPSIFQAAEVVLTQSRGWRKIYDEQEGGMLSVLISQIRSYLSVQDGETQGVHPYVVKKMRALRVPQPARRALAFMRALVAARSGLTTEKESQTLF